jgi:hypothetical protein
MVWKALLVFSNSTANSIASRHALIDPEYAKHILGRGDRHEAKVLAPGESLELVARNRQVWAFRRGEPLKGPAPMTPAGRWTNTKMSLRIDATGEHRDEHDQPYPDGWVFMVVDNHGFMVDP